MNEAEKTPKSEALTEAPPVPEEGMSVGSSHIESRFLFVDVAAQRAKQLRRGAVPRLENLPAADLDPTQPLRNRLKLERIAMREVDAGKIVYEVPSDDNDPPKAD